MTTDDHSFHRTDDDRLDARALVLLTLVAAAAGVVAGFVGGAFRWLLTRLDDWRGGLSRWPSRLRPRLPRRGLPSRCHAQREAESNTSKPSNVDKPSHPR